jgi:hypothetical protein
MGHFVGISDPSTSHTIAVTDIGNSRNMAIVLVSRFTRVSSSLQGDTRTKKHGRKILCFVNTRNE